MSAAGNHVQGTLRYEKMKRVQLDGTRAFLQKAVRDVHRVVVATLSGCAAGERVLIAGLHNVRTHHRCVVSSTSQCVQ